MPDAPTRGQVVPLSIAEANAFVRRIHRHHGRVVSAKFAIGWAVDGDIVACAIVGRPVARHLDNGWTLEVTRVASNGAPNACSALYAASWRAARALGYRRLVTYTLASESGTSLRAAGWRVVGEVVGRSWHCPSRPRVDKHPTLDKTRWEVSDA